MKSIKVRLELNHKQQTLAKKHAGTARFAYNWGLSKSTELMTQGSKRPSGIDLHKLWVAEVKPSHSWTYEVSKCSPQQALRNGFNLVCKTCDAKPALQSKRKPTIFRADTASRNPTHEPQNRGPDGPCPHRQHHWRHVVRPVA